MKQVVEVSCSYITNKVNNLIDLLDALPRHTTVTRTKCQFNLVTLGIETAGSMLATYNAVQISKLEDKIAANNKKVDSLIVITNLHEKHFKAVNQKLDDISNQLATMLQINKKKFILPKLQI
jgi:pyrimidine operon attenuation protein/uracil phosphoribosyltransferase